MTVAYEALAWGRHVNRVGQAWEAVQRADHPAVTLAVDTFHMLARGDDGAALADIPGDRIGFLQVADAPLLDMNLLEWSRHYRCFPGQGTLDVTGVVAATLAAGYGSALPRGVQRRRPRGGPGTSPPATRCGPWCSSRTSSRASYPISSRTVTLAAAAAASATDRRLPRDRGPTPVVGRRAAGRPRLRRGGAAPLQAGDLVAQRATPTWWSTRSRRRRSASALGVSATTRRGRRSASLRTAVAGGRQHPRAPARRCCRGSAPRRDCTCSSATRPAQRPLAT